MKAIPLSLSFEICKILSSSGNGNLSFFLTQNERCQQYFGDSSNHFALKAAGFSHNRQKCTVRFQMNECAQIIGFIKNSKLSITV